MFIQTLPITCCFISKPINLPQKQQLSNELTPLELLEHAASCDFKTCSARCVRMKSHLRHHGVCRKDPESCHICKHMNRVLRSHSRQCRKTLFSCNVPSCCTIKHKCRKAARQQNRDVKMLKHAMACAEITCSEKCKELRELLSNNQTSQKCRKQQQKEAVFSRRNRTRLHGLQPFVPCALVEQPSVRVPEQRSKAEVAAAAC